MDKTTIFQRIQKVENEVALLTNTLFALKSTNIVKYGANYTELSTNATLRAERIACQLKNLVLFTDFKGNSTYMIQAADALGIKISYKDRIFSATLPGLLPKRRLHTNMAFLRDPLHTALKEFLKDHEVEMIGISGEFPADQLPRLFDTPAYTEKLITELKADKLIRLHYKDRLRGYRLKKQAKELLLSHNPLRFQYCLTGNSETNAVRSEPQRRLRLYQKAQTYVTLSHADIPFFADEKPSLFCENFPKEHMNLQDIPCFYSSREIKGLRDETTKIRNSRSIGILMAPHCVYCIYNTGSSLMKWEYQAEVRLNAFLQHYLKIRLYNGQPDIRAIVFGNDMDVAFQLLKSTGGKQRGLFMLDSSFPNFYFLPSNAEGELLLKLLMNPKLTARLNQLLLSDLKACRGDTRFEYDAVTPDGVPSLLAYDFDMQRINRFNTGLNVFGMSGNLICFDFQIPVLEKYIDSNVHFSSIDLDKFRKDC